MPITQGQADRIGEAAKGLLSRPCEICSTQEWILHNDIVGLSTVDLLTRAIQADQVYPVVAIRCSNCQHTHFFNAMGLGLEGLS